jgi:transcriptional regulator with XRE-family HTH domain
MKQQQKRSRGRPPHEPKTELGRMIRAVRLKRRLSIAQAAQRAGLPYPTWSDAESGRREPGVATLVKISKALDLPIERLLTGVTS